MILEGGWLLQVSRIPLPSLSDKLPKTCPFHSLFGSVHSFPLLLVFQAEFKYNISGYSEIFFFFTGILFVFKNVYVSYKHLQLNIQDVFEESFRIYNWLGILFCFIFISCFLFQHTFLVKSALGGEEIMWIETKGRNQLKMD